MTRVAVTGAAGRMGRVLVELIMQHESLVLGAATEREDAGVAGKNACALAGLDSGNVNISSTLDEVADRFDVVIDFTSPDALGDHLQACVEHGKGAVIGTTGLAEDGQKQLREAAKFIPIVYAPNMSVGVNVLLELVEHAARQLGSEYDVEIFEAHHRHKVDAPSGTALKLGEVVASVMDRDLEKAAVYDRHGNDEKRERNSIGFSVARGGDIVGDHTVMFASDGERIELTHRASNRKAFASGALRAAIWLADRPAGLYDMRQVLGLTDAS